MSYAINTQKLNRISQCIRIDEVLNKIYDTATTTINAASAMIRVVELKGRESGKPSRERREGGRSDKERDTFDRGIDK